MGTLAEASILQVEDLSISYKKRMFALYETYYVGSDETRFLLDLQMKSQVILLRDEWETLQGFSTLALYEERYDGKPLRIIYSGDTIIDKAFWGQSLFAKTWLQLAGKLTAKDPEIPLYWLLIVKGHRTYRYLQLFSQDYYPRYGTETPASIQALINHLALRRFGEAYVPEQGLVYFPEPRSFLHPDLAIIPEKDLKRPEVQFFLSKNPNYTQGDELVCLCRLEENNLTRFAKRWFLEGAQMM
jgi:hypothetical protein